MRSLLFEALFERHAPPSRRRRRADGGARRSSRAALDRAARQRLGRSLSIREVDAGSCNGCELEIHALNNAVYDLERFGLRFVASPRHADVLLVTGPVTATCARRWRAPTTPRPSRNGWWRVGDCAADCGVFAGSRRVVGRVAEVLPVDLHDPRLPADADRDREGPAGADGGRVG